MLENEDPLFPRLEVTHQPAKQHIVVMKRVRRVRKNNIVAVWFLRNDRPIAWQYSTAYLCPIRNLRRLKIARDCVQCAPIRFDEYARRRPARQRFDPDGARPREQVQKPCALDARRKDIEQRLAHAVQCRPHVQSLGRDQPYPARRSSNYSHLSLLPTPHRQAKNGGQSNRREHCAANESEPHHGSDGPHPLSAMLASHAIRRWNATCDAPHGYRYNICIFPESVALMACSLCCTEQYLHPSQGRRELSRWSAA